MLCCGSRRTGWTTTDTMDVKSDECVCQDLESQVLGPYIKHFPIRPISYNFRLSKHELHFLLFALCRAEHGMLSFV